MSPTRTDSAVVGTALLVGAGCALLLTLAVLPGATESVTTGSLLLGFGVGWAALAVLSERVTTRPQAWARVPAVAMAATGVVLVVVDPHDGTLTRLTWLWAPALLVLTAWTSIRVRRSVAGGGRWLLVPVLVVLALAGVGAMVQTVTTQHTVDTYPAPGSLLPVGDHRLHLDCRGEGGPTVVLFNGLGEISASWAKVADPVGTSTRVCAYDRAGQAWSDDVDEPQDGIAAARDLRALLAAAGEEGPYVLVGHSIGGLYAMTYASAYPDDVAGMVLLDGTSPRQLTDVPGYPLQYAVLRRGLAVGSVLSRLGAGGLAASGSGAVRALTATPRAARNSRDEISVLPMLLTQAQALTTLGSTPLVVVTASENAEDTDGWAAAQDRMAELSTDSEHLTATASHQGLLDDDGGAAASVSAIELALGMAAG